MDGKKTYGREERYAIGKKKAKRTQKEPMPQHSPYVCARCGRGRETRGDEEDEEELLSRNHFGKIPATASGERNDESRGDSEAHEPSPPYSGRRLGAERMRPGLDGGGSGSYRAKASSGALVSAEGRHRVPLLRQGNGGPRREGWG
ncbi:hypothetical protein HPB50_001092 [Hyalomma asiaticum]|uniref:Uncharacterized protein n=1 Tax=Hyalomma asiaticum TaxID=266040 RepID=A0ACB7TCX1_HYAAI|nr:hypothetical protein HPB50_001092 [Hyalomma asiaticum]